MEKGKRDYSVTIAKAIAIILMVMGHSGCPEFINNYLGMIRMPLFFFMSGYCFKESYLNTPKDYIKKRIKGVYWPYVKWGVVFLIFTNILVSLNILSATEYINEYPKNLCRIIFAMKGVSSMLGGYWFLNSLFFGSIIFYICRKIKINLFLQGVILFLFSIVLNYFKDNIHVWNFNWLNFFAAFFIWSGHYYKTNRFNIHKSYKFIITSGVGIAIICLFWHSSMTNCPYWGMPIYALSAISGTLMIFGISYYIKDFKNKSIELLVYIGGYTFNILTWHFISMKLVSLAIIIIYQQPISRLSEFPVIKEYSEYGYWVIYTIIGVTIPTIGTYVYHKMINSRVSYIKTYIFENINYNK